MADRKAQGIDAENQDFARYEQVDKKQRYHLAEASHEEAFDETYRIKSCDIGRFLHGGDTERKAFAEELGGALREIGFAILEGHGTDPKLYDQANDKVIELFTRTSLEEKLRFRAQRHGSVNQGYFPLKETSDIHPDLVEGWSSAAAPSISRTIRRSGRGSRTSGRYRSWSRFSGGCAWSTRGSSFP